VTASEFSFLALGLVLGVVSGAAIVELIRARPRSPREVKVTVAHDAIPRRASTLADDAFTSARPEPARGGPADRRGTDGTVPAGATDRRTSVRFTTAGAAAGSRAVPSSAGGPGSPVPVGPGPDAPTPGRIMEPALPLTGIPPARTRGPTAERVAIPISDGDDPVFTALRLEALAAALAAERDRERHSGPAPDLEAAPVIARPPTAVGLLDPPGGAGGGGVAPGAVERCAEERRLAEERCELATRARSQADAAVEALRLAQRAYDAHEAAALEASAIADARAIHAAKEAAQGGFRSAVRAAGDPDALEAAARDWLTEINRINNEAREAASRAAREHAAAADIGATLERLGLEADAARISADNADAACLAARAVVADCDERALSDTAAAVTAPPPSSSRLPGLEEDETLGLALEAGGAPRIFRLLHGDRAAMAAIVATLAGDDGEARRRWQLQLTGLIEAIIADAIEAAYLEFPIEHPFWGSFTRAQNRDITQALSSLGFRFDGLGGWSDGRYPSQRDLSLALGYAGLDPMRVRNWPNDEATLNLFHDVTVAADEYLAGVAGDLTLAEMVTMLGRRADALADVWNQWGRIRPLLLEEA
jgi:hypothetical protein